MEELNNEEDIMRELTREEMEVTGGACADKSTRVWVKIKANTQYKINELFTDKSMQYWGGASYQNFHSYSDETFQIYNCKKLSGRGNYKFETRIGGLYIIAKGVGAVSGSGDATYELIMLRRCTSGNNSQRIIARFRVS